MTPPLVIGTVAYAIAAIALLVRDMLWLRVLGFRAAFNSQLRRDTATAGPSVEKPIQDEDSAVV
jgi:hypothetical protein